MQASQAKSTISPFWQRCFVVGLLVLFVVFSMVYSHKAMKGGSALVRWLPQMRELVGDGKDIYEAYIHPNSPMLVILLFPFTALLDLTAGVCWFYLKVVMALLAFHWAFRLVEHPDRPWPPWGKALVVVLSVRPILGDLTHGNVNLLILFLVVAALYAFHQRNDWFAGLILGLAIVCKVTPALFVPYFVWKRAWKTLAGCLVGLVVFVGIVPSCFYGPVRNVHLWTSWGNGMIKPFVLRGEVFYSELNNQSLPGLLMRLVTHNPSASHYDENNTFIPDDYHNVITLDARVVTWFVRGCLVGFALLVIWSCRTPLTQRQGWRLPAEFGLVMLGMLLFSERTWKHHCVTLLLPFTVLCYYVAACRPSRGLRAYLIASLTAVVLLMSATSTGLHEDEMGKLAQVYGAYVWSYLVLGAALVVLLRQRDPGAPLAA
jgi:hypothetical protein